MRTFIKIIIFLLLMPLILALLGLIILGIISLLGLCFTGIVIDGWFWLFVVSILVIIILSIID